MRFFTKDLEIVSCGRYNLLPPGANRREKPYTDIAYCMSGKGVLTMHNKSYPIEAGQCFALFPNVPFVMISDALDPWGTAWASFTGSMVLDALAHAGVSPRSPVFPFRDQPSILNRLNALIDEYGEESPDAELLRFSNAYRLLADLIRLSQRIQTRPASHASPQTGDCIQDTVEFIRRNYHRDLTIAELAQKAGLTRSYFSTLFRSRVGMSPLQYLLHLRVAIACECLVIKSTSISSIARTVGYDPLSFSRVFRQVLGMSPSEYRALPREKCWELKQSHRLLSAVGSIKGNGLEPSK